jgi:hypothetical protein
MTDNERAAQRIREVAQDERVGSVIAAARILPLVAWDVDLAIDYFLEEVEAAMASDDRASAKRKAAREGRAALIGRLP